jgi:hypothetical protein
MLQSSQILELTYGTSEWNTFWAGKISSSRISSIINPEGISESGRNYLLHKAMERVCPIKEANPADLIDEDDPEWGKKYESEAIALYCSLMGCDPIKTQKIIHKEGTKFGSIPDGLFLKPIDKQFIAIPVEVKCPSSYQKFYKAYISTDPKCIKEYDNKHYWQVIDQMQSCDAFMGHLLYYHPYFPKDGNYNLITFKREELIEDFILLDLRKKEAEIIIHGFIDSFYSVQKSRMTQ